MRSSAAISDHFPPVFFDALEGRQYFNNPGIIDFTVDTTQAYPGKVITLTAHATDDTGVRAVSFWLENNDDALNQFISSPYYADEPLGDVFAPDFRFSADRMQRFAESGRLAHLWLVPNPAHNARGDFGLAPDGLVLSRAEVQHTYSTIGLYRKALFAPPYCNLTAGNPTGRALALAPLLRHAMQERRVSGELYAGTWIDIGTPQRLQEVNRHPLA